MILCIMTHDMHYRPYEIEVLSKYFGELKNVCLENLLENYKSHKPEYILWKLDCEKTTKDEWKMAVDLANKIKAKHINHPKAWINCNLKEKTFEVWKEAGINIPDYFEFKTLKEYKPKWYPNIVRVNNNCDGRDSVFIESRDDIDKVRQMLKIYRERKKTYADTKLLCVKYIDFRTGDKYIPVYRAIVAGRQLTGGMVRLYNNDPSQCFKFVLSTDDKIRDKIGMDESRTECLVKHYKRLQEIFKLNRDYFIIAGMKTGLDSVAMDFLDADGFYMLEVQSDFEIKLQDKKPKAKKFKKWYKKNEEHFKSEIPLFTQWMDKKKLMDSIYRAVYNDIGN